MRELCRLHNVPLPSELDSLMLPQPMPGDFLSNYSNLNQEQQAIDDSDPDDIEDGVGESEPESEVDEDLPLEMDDSRNSNKVNERIGFPFFRVFPVCTTVTNSNVVSMWIITLQKDEMEVEHLATLERLRQSQRQDYLKVIIRDQFTVAMDRMKTEANTNGIDVIEFIAGLCIRFSASNRSFNERTAWYLSIGIL